ncbi:MAG: hypothetical protein IJ184_04605 [Alphaproteobacteria bacterium]|nr:hypothetical protein [Alphaproteobacteria bacterium]
MDNSEKIKNVAAMLTAMGLADTQIDRVNTIRLLTQELGLSIDELALPETTNSSYQGVFVAVREKRPLALHLVRDEKTGLDIAHLGSSDGEILGIAWKTPNDKTVVFSHYDHFHDMTLTQALAEIDQLPTINGKKWRVPTTNMFLHVNKLGYRYNDWANRTPQAEPLDDQMYLDAESLPDAKVYPHIRLAIVL